MAEIGVDIDKAAALLRAGKLVAIPTETVYGLAGNALNPEAVVSIFNAKNRPFFDPLIVHLKSASDIVKYAETTTKAQLLAESFWPGPLTLVLPKKDLIPEIVTAGQPNVALRTPNHALTLELLRKIDFPLAAPSANPFGYVSPTSALHVNKQLGEKIDYILDGGECTVGLESTIVSLANDPPELLRLGGLDSKLVEPITGPLLEKIINNSNPTAPGQLDKHYAPNCRLIPYSPHLLQDGALEHSDIVLLRYQHISADLPASQQWVLAPDGRVETAATNLFRLLRKLDDEKIRFCLFEYAPDTGLGRAINDRLRRSAT